mgnify:CR=1 FL=1
MGDVLVGHATGMVHDNSNRGHTKVTMPSTHNFSHCAHTNNICTKSAECSDLCWSLEAGAKTGQVHTISEGDILITGARVQDFAKLRVVCVKQAGKPCADGIISSDERIASLSSLGEGDVQCSTNGVRWAQGLGWPCHIRDTPAY